MKKIKHSKYKNTGILFELLVRQIATDTMENVKSPAYALLKKHFNTSSDLGKELQYYQTLMNEKFQKETSGEKFISAVVSARKKLSESNIRRQKYNLIKDIKETFNIDTFFASRVNNYKILASIYKLFEYSESDNPASLINAKGTLSEHITGKASTRNIVKETFATENSDVRILSQKMLIDKFNSKYGTLDARQKSLLREYINNITNSVALKEYIDIITPELQTSLKKSMKHVSDKVTRIKLAEVVNMLSKFQTLKLVKDKHILTLLRYYELDKELNMVK